MLHGTKCTLLQWDSDHYGFPIARISCSHLVPESISAIDQWCAENAIRCLYFLASSDDYESVCAATTGNFILADTRVSYVLELVGRSSKPPVCTSHSLYIRRQHSCDIDILCSIASRSYLHSRFCFDEHFPHARACQLYVEWIRKSCEHSGAVVFVAEQKNRIVGYIACNVDTSTNTGNIALMAVDNSARGAGVGHSLVETACEWFVTQSMTCVNVVTQGRNIPAQRLYQRCGFLLNDMKL